MAFSNSDKGDNDVPVIAVIGLNIFYSGRKYAKNDWVRLKVRRYPLPVLVKCLLLVYFIITIIFLISHINPLQEVTSACFSHYMPIF